MRVEDLRFYGRPFTDAEGSWPKDVRKRMKRRAMRAVRGRLRFGQLLRFGLAFRRARRRVRAIDLAPFRARGLDNEQFIQTQLEYLAFFIALQEILGTDRAVELACEVMEVSSREPMRLCLPEPADVYQVGDPFEVFSRYWAAMPEAGARGGSHAIHVHEASDEVFQFNVTWCVWLELARAAGVPEACIPNCHADDLVFPDYFADLGITYRRTQTLAKGCSHCDFRFERGCAPPR